MWEEVVDLVAELSRQSFANPSGSHRAARDARRILEESRDQIAEFMGARPSEVIWCSGGTEADNLAVSGLGRAGLGTSEPGSERVMVTSAIEHPAILESAARRRARIVGATSAGLVDLDQLTRSLDAHVGLVTIMTVNNEVGTIQPMAEINDRVRQAAPDAVIHTDAVQAAPWLDLTAVWAHVDAMSVSAHKIGGPKGVGVLVVREGTRVVPTLVGGGQERERRSGTQNVVGAAAMAAAATLTLKHRLDTIERVGRQRDRLVDGLRQRIDGVVETVEPVHKVAGNAHVCIAGVESEALLFLLDRDGIAASAASSCASGAQQSSGVLAAMGVSAAQAAGAVRFTLGATTTDADIDRVLEVVPGHVDRLREMGS